MAAVYAPGTYGISKWGDFLWSATVTAATWTRTSDGSTTWTTVATPSTTWTSV